MKAPVNKHAKNLIAATVCYPHQMSKEALFELMRDAAAELDRLQAQAEANKPDTVETSALPNLDLSHLEAVN